MIEPSVCIFFLLHPRIHSIRTTFPPIYISTRQRRWSYAIEAVYSSYPLELSVFVVFKNFHQILEAIFFVCLFYFQLSFLVLRKNLICLFILRSSSIFIVTYIYTLSSFTFQNVSTIRLYNTLLSVVMCLQLSNKELSAEIDFFFIFIG